MIAGMLDELTKYDSVYPGLAAAVAFVQSAKSDLPDGRYEIDGDRIFASVATYTTEPAEARRFEGHRKYVDLQVLLEGVERMDVAPVAGLAESESYDFERDLLFFSAPERFDTLRVAPGQGAVFGPDDAHRPNCAWGSPASVRKVVVKIAVAS